MSGLVALKNTTNTGDATMTGLPYFVVDAFIWRLRKDSNYAVVSAQPAAG